MQELGTGRLSRRELLAGAAAGAIVIGFEPVTRTWVSTAQASSSAPFDDAPDLDGTLHLDHAPRDGASTDLGNFTVSLPAAVLRPGSVDDVCKMVAYCADREIPVSARGAAHTTYGQGLTSGLIVEMRSLAQVHAISPAGAEVDGGVLWSDLVRTAYDHGLTPPVLTGYLELTVGGTLAVGGVSCHPFGGLQIERFQQLEVVDGRGHVHRCSRTQNRPLFEAVRGGLGQYGIVTRAWLDLVPAFSSVRLWRLTYVDHGDFLADFNTLLARGEVDEAYGEWIPGQAQLRQLYVAKYFEPGGEPEAMHYLRGLTVPALAAPGVDSSYLDHVLRVTPQIEALEATGWREWLKPWYDVFLPSSAVEAHMEETLAELTPLDVGEGFVLLFAQNRSQNTSSTYPYPQADGDDWFFLFDILPALPQLLADRARELVDVNRKRFESARSAGGTRYPIGALDFTVADWEQQYGAHRYAMLRGLKQAYDPAGILAQGVGMF